MENLERERSLDKKQKETRPKKKILAESDKDTRLCHLVESLHNFNPGEGKRQNEFAEWHNYAKYDLRGNKLTEERVMFSRQFYKSSSFFSCGL